jgi:membrane associated rhomboid family serine protease
MFPLRDTYPSSRFPAVTLAIVLVNALAFLFELQLDEVTLNDVLNAFGTVPGRFWWPSLITSQFLHGGWAHFLGNMWFLWIFGDNVEDLLGRGRYLLFYLAGGIAGGLLHVFTNPGSDVPTIGASGAIAAVMGAYLLRFRESRILMFFFPFFLFELPAPLVLAGWFLLQFFGGVGALMEAPGGGGTAWFAHVGGFLAGMGLVKAWGVRRATGRSEWYW